jgi:hypothetical protein
LSHRQEHTLVPPHAPRNVPGLVENSLPTLGKIEWMYQVNPSKLNDFDDVSIIGWLILWFVKCLYQNMRKFTSNRLNLP